MGRPGTYPAKKQRTLHSSSRSFGHGKQKQNPRPKLSKTSEKEAEKTEPIVPDISTETETKNEPVVTEKLRESFISFWQQLIWDYEALLLTALVLPHWEELKRIFGRKISWGEFISRESRISEIWNREDPTRVIVDKFRSLLENRARIPVNEFNAIFFQFLKRNPTEKDLDEPEKLISEVRQREFARALKAP